MGEDHVHVPLSSPNSPCEYHDAAELQLKQLHETERERVNNEEEEFIRQSLLDELQAISKMRKLKDMIAAKEAIQERIHRWIITQKEDTPQEQSILYDIRERLLAITISQNDSVGSYIEPFENLAVYLRQNMNKLLTTAPGEKVALCFSGGGIRSGSFQMGVLRALEENNVLREVDYLSTVSGGGYTGSAFMTHMTANNGDRGKSIDQLELKMRANANYLFTTFASSVYFIAAVLFGALHNILFLFALAVVGSSILYSGYTPGIICIRSGNSYCLSNQTIANASPELIANLTRTVTQNITYSGAPIIVSWLGFYSLEFDVARLHASKDFISDAYRSSLFQQTWFLITIFSIGGGVALLLILILFYRYWGTCREPVYDAEKDEAEMNKKQTLPDLVINRFLFWVSNTVIYAIVVCASLVVAFFVGVEILKLIIVGFAYQHTQNANSAAITVSVLYIAVIIAGSLVMLGTVVTDVEKILPLKICLYIITLITPFIFIVSMARLCVWYMFEHPPGPYDISLDIIELLAWLAIILQFIFSQVFDSALHIAYRNRLRESFYYKAKDVSFHKLIKRPLYICNATLNNFEPSYEKDEIYRTYHPFTLTQVHVGSKQTGFRYSEEQGTTVSFGMAVSGAAISINLGGMDSLISSVPLRFTLKILSANMGHYLFMPGNPIRGHVKKPVLLAMIVHYMLKALAILTLLACVIVKTTHGINEYYFESQNSSESFYGFMIFFQVVIGCYLCLPPLISIFFEILHEFGMIIHTLQRKHGGVLTWLRRYPINDLPLWRGIGQILGLHESRHCRYVFLSDGGHFENLAMYEILRRKVSKIMVFDGGQDSEYHLADLYNCLLLAKYDRLISDVILEKRDPTTNETEFSFVDDLAPLADLDRLRRTKANFIQFTVKYPDGTTGTVFFGKATLSGTEEGLVKLHALGDKVFPHTSTANQMFTPLMFDAYKNLGAHVGHNVARAYLKNKME